MPLTGLSNEIKLFDSHTDNALCYIITERSITFAFLGNFFVFEGMGLTIV